MYGDGFVEFIKILGVIVLLLLSMIGMVLFIIYVPIWAVVDLSLKLFGCVPSWWHHFSPGFLCPEVTCCLSVEDDERECIKPRSSVEQTQKTECDVDLSSSQQTTEQRTEPSNPNCSLSELVSLDCQNDNSVTLVK